MSASGLIDCPRLAIIEATKSFKCLTKQFISFVGGDSCYVSCLTKLYSIGLTHVPSHMGTFILSIEIDRIIAASYLKGSW